MEKSIVLVAVFVMAFTLSVGNLMAQGVNSGADMRKMKKRLLF